MNPEIKAMWVKDLRENADKQGKGSLKSQDRYCCLGRLCDLYIRETGEGFWDEDDSFDAEGSISCAYLPGDVCLWAGLDNPSPKIAGENLSRINDRGATFPEIADMIEREL